jgi:mannose-6-phosphate isomerase-like protein (cupin superfamily)
MYDEPATSAIEEAPQVRAPDGSAVRPLCEISGVGSFAHFQLEPGETARAVSHATVQEIWYVIGGTGQMWRQQEGREPILTELRAGICMTIPLGTTFQFRAGAKGDPLTVVAVTMPPWPVRSKYEARLEKGPWAAAFRR